MDVYKVALKRRSIRLFKKRKIPVGILRKLINAGRLAPSAANLQPCEFIVVTKKGILDKIFPCLKWAGYIKPQGNPPKSKEPTAYIIVLINRRKSSLDVLADAAAAVESMLLVAEDEGIGNCWLGAIDRKKTIAISFMERPP